MKIRFRFNKTGRLRFISHLDVNRTMIRMLRTAGIPLAYSQGFNPRPMLTFALPLSLGTESVCETMDVTTSEDIDMNLAMVKMNYALPPQMQITDVWEAVTDPRSIAGAQYRVVFEGAGKNQFEAFWSQPEIKVMKKTKSDSREIELKCKTQISGIEGEDNRFTVTLVLPAGSAENINPSLLCEAFREYCGGMPEYLITRTAVLDREGKEFR